MLIIGQHVWQNKGPAHGPQQRKPRAHALAHKHQHSINPGNSYIKINAPHDFITFHHPIQFHSTLHQGQHKDRSNESCGLMHWHTYKINVTPNRDSNAFPILNVRALLNNGSNRKHAHVAIFSTRCGTLTRFSNDV